MYDVGAGRPRPYIVDFLFKYASKILNFEMHLLVYNGLMLRIA